MADGDALYYMLQAYRHLKPLAFVGDAREIPKAAGLPDDKDDAGLIMENDAEKAAKGLVEAMKQHRIWSREKIAKKVAA
jgi:catalase